MFLHAATKASAFGSNPDRRPASKNAILIAYGVGIRSVLPTVDVARDVFSEKSAVGLYRKIVQGIYIPAEISCSRATAAAKLSNSCVSILPGGILLSVPAICFIWSQ